MFKAFMSSSMLIVFLAPSCLASEKSKSVPNPEGVVVDGWCLTVLEPDSGRYAGVMHRISIGRAYYMAARKIAPYTTENLDSKGRVETCYSRLGRRPACYWGQVDSLDYEFVYSRQEDPKIVEAVRKALFSKITEQ